MPACVHKQFISSIYYYSGNNNSHIIHETVEKENKEMYNKSLHLTFFPLRSEMQMNSSVMQKSNKYGKYKLENNALCC